MDTNINCSGLWDMQGWICEAECWDDDQSSGCELSLFGKQIWSSVKPDLLCPSLYRSKKSGTPSTLANWKVTPWYRDLSCISRWLNLYVRDMQRHAQTILLEELVVWCLNKPNELPFLWDSSHAKACSKNSLEELAVWCLNKPHKLPFLRDTWHAKACRSRISSWIVRGINPRNPVISFDFMWFQHLLLGTYDTYAFRGVNGVNEAEQKPAL